jgi:LPS sulfotransferase NodH
MDPKGRIKWSYLICTTHRSGSTLLSEGITAAGCGDANEYFEESMERIWKEKWQLPADAEPITFLREVIARATTRNGIFGAKLMWHQIESLEKKLRPMLAAGEPELPLSELLNRAFGNPRFIWLKRADKVKQATSLVRAEQTGRWHSVDLTGWVGVPPTMPEECFDFAEIDLRVTTLKFWDSEWKRFFKRNGIKPLTLVYEEFAPHYEETLFRVLEFLGAKVRSSFVFPPPRLEKQADETSQQWEAEYLARKKDAATAPL